METIKPEKYPCATIYKIRHNEIKKFDLVHCAEPAETLEHFYARQTEKPDILCNGGFFDMLTGNTVFTYSDDGSIISIDNTLLEGITIVNNRPVLTFFEEGMGDFISAYPVFMKKGSIVNTNVASDINYRAQRTILGFDDIFTYLIFIEKISKTEVGYNFSEIKQLLIDYTIPNAINLDGGGSTRCLYKGEKKIGQAYSRPVDNVVAIYLKDPVIYRVQTGAFSNRQNAENYKKKIQSLPDNIGAGYKNAYIRLIDGVYKVQVGAFSVKLNAEKVLADLREKGYNGFITIK